MAETLEEAQCKINDQLLESAFPRGELEIPGKRYLPASEGLNKAEYAAIHLKVPNSGNAEIDVMVRKSLRGELAQKVLVGMVSITPNYRLPENKSDCAKIAKLAFMLVDAMTKEMDK